MKIPMVVAHRINQYAYHIVNRFIDTPYIALPNILSKQKVVPEYIQHLDASTLATELLQCQEQSIDLSAVGSSGAAQRIAKSIHGLLHD